ncbi:MAG: orotate phosphoribosyltransferase [Bacteroidota bacterium]|nr:orotate phosphoribosyltransferase [Bacteroidota bacterium]
MQISHTVATKIAEYLLQIKAIKLQPNEPFTWASGLKSPIYSDNRLSLSHPEIRTFIKNALAASVKENFPESQAIVGVATAGIAPGVLVADLLELPFGYVRAEAKKHGMGKQVEGDISPAQSLVVIEDLVSTGKSSLQAIDVLRDYGSQVLGLACIFTYGLERAIRNFEDAQVPFVSLCNYDILIQVALQKGYVNDADMDVLKAWRKNPETWNI